MIWLLVILSVLLLVTMVTLAYVIMWSASALARKDSDYAALEQLLVAKEVLRGEQTAKLLRAAWVVDMVASDLSTNKRAEPIKPHHLDRPIDQCVKAAAQIRENVDVEV